MVQPEQLDEGPVVLPPFGTSHSQSGRGAAHPLRERPSHKLEPPREVVVDAVRELPEYCSKYLAQDSAPNFVDVPQREVDDSPLHAVQCLEPDSLPQRLPSQPQNFALRGRDSFGVRPLCIAPSIRRRESLYGRRSSIA